MIVDFSDCGAFTEDDEDENTRSSRTATEDVDSMNDVEDNVDRGVSEGGTADESDDVNWSSDDDDDDKATTVRVEVYKNEGTSCHAATDIRDDYLRQDIQPRLSSTMLDNGDPLPCIEPDVKHSAEEAFVNTSASPEVEGPDFESFPVEHLDVSDTSPESLLSLQGQIGGSNSGSSCSTNGDDDYIQMRRKIIAIRKDANLTEQEKRVRIQLLMDRSGTSARASGSLGDVVDPKFPPVKQEPHVTSSTTSSTAIAPYAVSGPLDCPHYDSKCRIVAPCCQKIFGCRVCHDEAVEEQQSVDVVRNHGPLDRYSINQIVCNQCGTLQSSKTNVCSNRKCNTTFAKYHCSVCNIWMSDLSQPFHCAECGICRIGGRENFLHCHDCCMCLAIHIFKTHKCIVGKFKTDCPVCQEDLFSSRQVPQDLPCGHVIHKHCFRILAGYDYRCPVCKKTIVSQQTMESVWASRSREIELQPMPADLQRTVNIICNDCGMRGMNENWHFLGVRCSHCRSFNTIVEDTVSTQPPTMP